MRIFITGGTGFVGRHVVKKLQSEGHDLLILSRKPKSAVSLFKMSKRTAFVKGGLSNVFGWKNKVRSFGPDTAVHMAWEGIPDYGVETSLKNLKYGLDLIKMLADIKCKKVLVTGSCWEHGEQAGKLSEDVALKPYNIFSAAKNSLRLLGEQIAKEGGMQFIWARIFYVYGPGQKSTSLIPHLIESARADKKAEIKNPSGGNDFVYVEDVASALAMILEKRIKKQSVVYNIGSGKLTSVEKIVSMVYGNKNMSRKVTGFYANITKIKKEIGWSPSTSIKEGIMRTIEYHHKK